MKRLLASLKPSHFALLLGAGVMLAVALLLAVSMALQYSRELDDAQRSMDGLSRALAIQTERSVRDADRTLIEFLRRKRQAAENGFAVPPSAAEFGAANPTIVSLAYVSVAGGAGDVTAEAAARRAFAEAGGDPVLVPRLDGLVSVVRRDVAPDGTVVGAVVAVLDPAWLADFNHALNFSGESVTTLVDDYGVVVARNGTDDGGDRLVSSAAVGEYMLTASISLPKFVLLAGWHRELKLFAAYGAVGCVAFSLLVTLLARQWGRRERAEAAARLSETRFRDFAEAASDWLWETDADHRFVHISERFAEFTGGRLEDFLGKTRRETMANAADAAAVERHMEDFAAHRLFRDFVYPIRTARGIRHIRVNGRPCFDEAGTFTGYRGTASDVTDIVEAENRLRDAKNQAEFASRAKSEFLANMSHELRTPLNAVIGFSEIIYDQLFGNISRRYVEYARDINMSGRHLLDLINDVLDMSKIEAGRYELHEEPVNLGETARLCATLMATRIAEGGVEVVCGPELAAAMVRADARAVKQILLNILSNAVKFTPPRGRVTVGVEAAAGGGLAVRVSDTGIGMAPEVVTHLAEPFYQADSSISRRFGGSGLGLAICRKLVELHGGRLEFDSREGAGTTVRVGFPRERVLAGPGAAVPRTTAA